MGIRIPQIGAGQGAVHTPVIVNAVHRSDPEQFNTIENNCKSKKEQTLQCERSSKGRILSIFGFMIMS